MAIISSTMLKPRSTGLLTERIPHLPARPWRGRPSPVPQSPRSRREQARQGYRAGDVRPVIGRTGCCGVSEITSDSIRSVRVKESDNMYYDSIRYVVYAVRLMHP